MVSREINNDCVVTVEMLQHLPAPVRRYLIYSGVVGKTWINTVHLRYSGKFRMAADKPWMPISAEQYYTTNPAGFVWKAWLKMYGLPLLRGQDTYKDCHGHMVGKIAGLYPLFDLRGEKLDQGSMMRYLNEMTWFPIAFLGENVTWQALDDCSAEVTLTDCGKSVSARIVFDDLGRITNFTCLRYRSHDGDFTLDPWSTPMTAYGLRSGLNLPVRGQAVWNLPSGDLPYIDIEINAIEYNTPVPLF